jgi:membrane-associated phospholipid phosphatase
MNGFDYFIGTVVSIIMIIGGYQLYFLPQKKRIRNPISLETKIDNFIPFDPRWVWIYSGLYYPIIIVLVFTVNSMGYFIYMSFSFICLLFMHILIAFLIPVKTPPNWRQYEKNESISTRFLSIVHHYDEGSNCFPSMHVAVAVLTSFHLANNLNLLLGGYSYFSHLFPILIAISSLFTKQHYIFDLPAGALLGFISYKLFILFI